MGNSVVRCLLALSNSLPEHSAIASAETYCFRRIGFHRARIFRIETARAARWNTRWGIHVCTRAWSTAFIRLVSVDFESASGSGAWVKTTVKPARTAGKTTTRSAT